MSAESAPHARALFERLRITSEPYKEGVRLREAARAGASFSQIEPALAPLRDANHPVVAELLLQLATHQLNLPGTGDDERDQLALSYVQAAAICSTGFVLCDNDSYRLLHACFEYSACNGASAEQALLNRLIEVGGIDIAALAPHVERLRRRIVGEGVPKR
jgi:hypothetical protein